MDILIDGVSVGTVDMYAASADYKARATITGVVLTAGAHTLTLQANGKHASSSAYDVYVSDILFLRTA